jgi:dihydrofolate reductase
MAKVLTHMTMSVDGYIADPDDQPGELFDWYQAGEVSVPSGNETVTFDVDPASAEALGDLTDKAGALDSGRRLFDIANGWNDAHPAGMPVVAVTHNPRDDAAKRWPKTTFVDGVELGIAKAREIAGDKNLTIASPKLHPDPT